MDIFTKFTTQFVNRVIDEANVFIIYTDANGNVTVCNKKVEFVAAKPKEEIIGKNWLSVLYPDNNNVGKPQMFKAVMDDSINYKRANNFEGKIIDKDKNEKLISWNITPILKNAEELEGVLLIGNDITELVEVEATRKKIDETLQNIFSSIKDYALYVINLDGNITYFGMAAETMFGWRKNEIIFKNVNQLHKNEDVQEKLPAILQEVRQSGQYETEIELVNKEGLGFPVILSVSKFLDAEGQLTGYIFFAKDITERKRLEYQMLQSEKLAAIGQLSAGIAHEINNPLFVISGRLEMILEQSDLNQKLRETLVIMNSQVERISGPAA
jgi:PAS domain S-box-containing protein